MYIHLQNIKIMKAENNICTILIELDVTEIKNFIRSALQSIIQRSIYNLRLKQLKQLKYVCTCSLQTLEYIICLIL